jgi:PAS domain S-box-containing protein
MPKTPAKTEKQLARLSEKEANVTESKLADDILRDREQNIHLLLDNIKDFAIFTLDPTGRVTSWNAGAEAIKGYTAQEIIGKHFSCFYTPDQVVNRVPDRVLHQAETQGRFEDEGPRVRKDGSTFWANVVVTPIRDDDGTLRGFTKVVRDITMRYQANESLHKQTTYIKLLQEIAASANTAGSEEETLHFALDRISQVTGWEIGHVFSMADDGSATLVSRDLWRLKYPARYEAFVALTDALRLAPGEDFPGMVLLQGAPMWLTDITQNPKFKRASAAKDIDLRTGVAFPVMVGHQVASVLEFYTENDVQPDNALLDVMAQIGTQLGRVVERAQAEKALRQSEARFRTIFEGAALGIHLIDLDGRLLESNPAARRMFGFSDDKLNRINRLNPTDFSNLIGSLKLFNELKNGARDHYHLEQPYRREDGQTAWERGTVSLVRDKSGKPQFIISMMEDITERKQMEADLVELKRRLMEGREVERLRLAQDLHDGPVQDLYGLTYNLQALAEVLQDGFSTQINEMQTNLLQVINRLRAICGELRPPTLAPFGLEKAIRSHAETFQEKHPEISVRLELMPDGQMLPERVRLALFRIYQHMLINVVRHAEASNIDIRLILGPEQVILEIQDDGKGFSVPSRWIELARLGHLGLVGAAERAENIGGRFVVESTPGKGTRVKVNVPRANEA